MKLLIRIVSSLIISSLLATPLFASDFAKEKRWANDIVGALIDGEPVWLNADGHKFLGIYTQSSAKKIKGAVIVLHGTGVHPNWQTVVYPARVRLTEHGWHTLSLQMPILANNVDIKDYGPVFKEIAPRLRAGLAYLESKGVKNVVILGHSLGSTMAAYFLATNKAPQVSALVAVGVSGTEFSDPGLAYFSTLPKISIPILDIYGSNDIEPVLSSVQTRADIARKSGHKVYDQVVVKGGDHFQTDTEDQFIKYVSDWLDKHGTR